MISLEIGIALIPTETPINQRGGGRDLRPASSGRQISPLWYIYFCANKRYKSPTAPSSCLKQYKMIKIYLLFRLRLQIARTTEVVNKYVYFPYSLHTNIEKN